MSVDRLERLNALLRREIGAAIPLVMANEGIDLAAVTVTHVEASRNLRHAMVSISVLGHERERGTILRKFADRHAEFQRRINRDLKLKYTPVLQFRLDTSVEKGDHVLDVLLKLGEAESSQENAASDEPGGDAPPEAGSEADAHS